MAKIHPSRRRLTSPSIQKGPLFRSRGSRQSCQGCNRPDVIIVLLSSAILLRWPLAHDASKSSALHSPVALIGIQSLQKRPRREGLWQNRNCQAGSFSSPP